MVRHFAAALGVKTAFVAESLDDLGKRARTIAFLRFGEFTRNVEYDVGGTPCETVMRGEVRIYPEGVQELFPEDRELGVLQAVGYLGLPLWDSQRRSVIGHLAAIHDGPLSPDLAEDKLLKVFASRAGAEVERRRIEEQLLQARKMESVGLLAGGIAHDFNNLLMGILGNISLARDRIDPSNRVHQLLREAERAANRAKRLTQQLLTLSKGGAPIRLATSVPKLVRDSTELALRGTNVRAEYEFPPDLWSADVDRGQVGQVIENLVINAVQAMPQGGVIRIVANNVTLGSGRGDSLEPGDYIRLEIQDHGPGIPPENLGRIFDPYFTTKESGTGLGLTTSYAIVTKHGGKLEVHPVSGGGSNFVIHIPGYEREPEDISIPGKVRFLEGPRRILFMDDEEMVRAVVEEMLKNLGYEVELAADGEGAIKKYREEFTDGIPFDAVILDLTVRGGMGGKEVMRRLINIDPNAVGIVCSGYSDDPVMAEFEQFGFRGRISKPFVATTLSEALASVLDD
jgi:signal transduction histidine kinase/CheY-like chemotaxis protein